MRAKCICIFERLLSIMYVLENIPVNNICGDLVLKGNILEVSFQILPTEYAKEDMLSGFGSSLNCAIHPRACMKLLSLLRNNENLCTWFSLLSAVFRKNFVLSRRRLRVRTKERKPYRTDLSFVA